MRIAISVVTGLASACVCLAQPTEGKPAAPTPPGRVRFEDLPPAAKLGVRAETLRRRIGVVPTVVIVPERASYAAAIASWNVEPRPGDSATIGLRYPVLIDDGTWRAREDIARFVRAFKPSAVVKWASPDAASWPEKPEEMQAAIERSAYKAWGRESLKEVKERWDAERFPPPGVVVASTTDSAWTAALALAAGHGQIFAWPQVQRNLSGTMTTGEGKKLNEAIQAACEAAGVPWKILGDHIDAVTLCMSTPASVSAGTGDGRSIFATTDVIGRGVDGEPERRWAWAGQIPGSEARAAYMAMCALFLEPERAWFFDGYDHSGAMAAWDASPAAATFEKAGIKSLLNDEGSQSAMNWRNRAAGMGLAINEDAKREPGAGIDAGFIAVNTSGHPDRFDLKPGQCRSGDVPFMQAPAAVHFVHSFSASRPGDRSTIAGRFLERGAYAYVGAVQEPYLQAFVPTPQLTQRVLALGAWGASVRLDQGPPWKVAVFGDPLWTVGPAAPRIEAKLPLADVKDIQEGLAPLLKEKQYAEALWILSMQGRDADAAKLVRVIDKDAAASLTQDVALAGVMAVFRSPGRDGAAGSGERLALLSRLSRLLETKFVEEPELRDIIWHAAYSSMTKLNEQQIEALAGAIRPEQSDRDAAELAGGAAASLGRDRAADLLRSVREKLTDAAAREAFDRAIRP